MSFLYFLATVGFAVVVSFVFGVLLYKLDQTQTGRSVLYDDPEYFNHDEPEWMRNEAPSCKTCKHFNEGKGDSICMHCDVEFSDCYEEV